MCSDQMVEKYQLELGEGRGGGSEASIESKDSAEKVKETAKTAFLPAMPDSCNCIPDQ